MANTTVRGAQAIHGQNPQVLRTNSCKSEADDISLKICSFLSNILSGLEYTSPYTGRSIVSPWLVSQIPLLSTNSLICATLAESLIDKAIALRAIGGVYGNQKPTEFICLLLKLLQIQPEKEILVEYLLVDEFKCVKFSALFVFVFYAFLTGIYELWQPCIYVWHLELLRYTIFWNRCYRTIANCDYDPRVSVFLPTLLNMFLLHLAGYSLTYVDEFVDQLLTEERVCDIILPRLPKRGVLEDIDEIGPRKSLLLNAMEGIKSPSRSRSRSRSPRQSRSPSRSRSRNSAGDGSAPPDRSLSRSLSRSSDALSYRSRSRSISPDRVNGS